MQCTPKKTEEDGRGWEVMGGRGERSMVRDEGGRGSRMGYRRTGMASGRRVKAAPR
jgi:hypothetical protein